MNDIIFECRLDTRGVAVIDFSYNKEREPLSRVRIYTEYTTLPSWSNSVKITREELVDFLINMDFRTVKVGMGWIDQRHHSYDIIRNLSGSEGTAELIEELEVAIAARMSLLPKLARSTTIYAWDKS